MLIPLYPVKSASLFTHLSLAGEPAELLVLCGSREFRQFKVVREVYLPEAGLWLSEYPFVEQDRFLQISLDIERTRALRANGGSPAPPPPPMDAQVLYSEASAGPPPGEEAGPYGYQPGYDQGYGESDSYSYRPASQSPSGAQDYPAAGDDGNGARAWEDSGKVDVNSKWPSSDNDSAW